MISAADASTSGASPYDVLVLAGGAASRLGGADKAGLVLGDRTLLDRVLAAVADAGRVIVVGPARPVARSVEWVLEAPPGGGPVAGIAAGLPRIAAATVAVLAADLPFLTPAALAGLRAALAPGIAGAVLVDADGRDQSLAGMWRTAALCAAVGALATPVGASVRRTVASLPLARVALPVDRDQPPPWWDCDTAEDVEQARSWL